jgi:hypothetical protein
MAMEMLMRRMGADDFTVHGFRSSFKTWAIETTSFPNELSEAALAHVTGSRVERAYGRTDVFGAAPGAHGGVGTLPGRLNPEVHCISAAKTDREM